ncbi:hypothetical protein [Aquimarina sp. AU58]|uniref:hypothetical protein n=1 Tax=Aquimarina sp. AU58 TaxID=1874112 RepID=UPI000D64ED86|nr:hypothetical protein [Aquimarina sp. AU58]
MKIHTRKTGFAKFILPGFILILLVIFSLSQRSNDKHSKKNNKSNPIETHSALLDTKGIEEMIVEDINLIHKDRECSLYFNNSFGAPTLYYIYKDSLNTLQKTDRVYVHIYLKDNSKLENGPFINLGLNFEPVEQVINESKYYIFRIPFVNKDLEINNVDYFNTGRYNSTTAKKSYQVNELKIDELFLKEILNNNFKKLVISLKKKAYTKIADKREEALEVGILSSEDSDLVKAEISSGNSGNLKAEIRLKGDWTDHLIDPLKWSFRIKLEDDKTLFGMRKFSIQHPKVRNYVWEWLFNKTSKENDLIGLRYDFLNVDLQVEGDDNVDLKNMGVMAIEESFDKLLIENNKRREGIIISFDESFLWDDRKKTQKLKLSADSYSKDLHSFMNAPIRVFNENKVLTSPNLSKQFKTAKNLLNELRNGNLKISEAFDVDKLTFFVALSNLFGGEHGLIWHNLRIYYNPITSKLEPISYDSDSGHKIGRILNYPFHGKDTLYQQKLIEKLGIVTSDKFIQNLINFKEFNSLISNINSEYNINFDISILEHNINFIKKQIYPSNTIVSYLYTHDSRQMFVDIENISGFPVVINGLQTKKGKALSKSFSDNIIIYPKERRVVGFILEDSFINAFVSKKNKKGEFRYPKDLAKIDLNYNILGSGYKRSDKIIPYTKEDTDFVNYYKEFSSFNLDSFNFISLNKKDSIIYFNSGEHITNKTIRIPSGYKVIVEKGFSLDLKDEASLVSFSPIFCKGTKESPINFFSSDATGCGIFVSNAKEKSILTYCNFNNLSNPKSSEWSLSGSVNFNESDVNVSNSVFENNRSEDGLNIIRSEFHIDSSIFRNTMSDAFDGDFVKGSIVNSKFVNLGNDGIDVSGSNLKISNIDILEPSDKAISIGEDSKLSGEKVRITGGEIGVVSKDLSHIVLNDVTISNTRLAFSCFQKKSEFGPGSIAVSDIELLNNELDYLIEKNSKLSIDKVFMETKSAKVIEKMYGKEYGKSSR